MDKKRANVSKAEADPDIESGMMNNNEPIHDVQIQLQLIQLLSKGADQLAKEDVERKRNRAKEVIELQGGEKTSLEELEAEITALRQPYEPVFSNENPFFKNIFRLRGWTDKNPNNYAKPSVVAKIVITLIYLRFKKEVLPFLRKHAMPDGNRHAKFFQHLTPKGLESLKKFRDDANAMMERYDNWYDFLKDYCRTYGLPFQLSLIDEK
ncbi:hypothetical protein DVR12_20375 [Chitinophaga silvatica]|uniref:Bacteriophage Mx8 p63 C-terminal domain-containing protein n=1 Tax=Chitinophaga silvatica TaxID=2282649 RepID=A0A3E1Y5R8_9BACT|nr:P63C domain-containing protein [Chitinophaga silvatica]RFS20078.1 hypothetical protein DVR12_20375 [Chitinophaga silvatica]